MSSPPSAEIRLRQVAKEDLPILFHQQQDPDAIRMAAFPSRNLEQFNAHWAGLMADPAKTLRTILADNEVAGYIASWTKEARRQVAYWIGKPHWGKGITTRALRLFLDIETTRPLFAHVAIHNIASIRVLEKSGFRILSEETSSDHGEDGVEELVMKLDVPQQNVTAAQ